MPPAAPQLDVLLSARAAARVAAARAWLHRERQRSALTPLVLLVDELAAAGDALRPLLLGAVGAGRTAPRAPAPPDAVARPTGSDRAHFNVARQTLDLLATELSRARLARRELNVATPLCLQAVVGRVLAEQQHRLGHFDRVVDGLGFGRALGRTLAELRFHRVRPRALAGIGAPAGDDLALLLQAYDEALAGERLVDRAGVLEEAVAAVADAEAPEALTTARYFLLDLTLHTPLEVALLAALRGAGATLRAALPLGDRRSQAAIADVLGEPADDHPTDDHPTDDQPADDQPADDQPADGHPANGASSLARLQRRLFAPVNEAVNEAGAEASHDDDLDETGGVELFSAPSADLECVEIARRILALADRGQPADRVAVLLRQPVPYAELLEQALGRAGLACHLSGAASRPDPAGRAFLLLLRCAGEELSAARFAEFLSLGQIRGPGSLDAGPGDGELDGAGETDGDGEGGAQAEAWVSPARWERLLGEAAVVGGLERWRTRLQGLRGELADRAAKLDDPDGGAAGALGRDLEQLDHLEAYALPLLERLATLPAEARWGEWVERLAELASQALARPKRVREVLEELWPLADSAPVGLRRVVSVLHDRLGELPRRARGHRYGRVFVGPIDAARGRSFEVVFVPGLAERIFPGKVLQDPVLLDRLRAALATGPAPLSLPVRDDRRRLERLALRLAVGAASGRLVLSYPRLDLATGQPRVPSFYFLEAARAVEGRLPHFEELVQRAGAGATVRLHRPSPRDAEGAVDAQEYDLARLDEARRRRGEAHLGGYLGHLHHHPHLIGALRAHWQRGGKRLTSHDGLVCSSARALELIADQSLERRPHAVTSLERFAACPYRFYLQSVLRLRPAAALGPPPEGQLDPLTRGQLFHRVQFELFRELDGLDALPVTPAGLPAALARLHETLGRVAARLREMIAPAVASLWAEEVAALELELRAWLQREATAEGYRPERWEYAFGLPPGPDSDPHSTEEPARVDRFLLRGAIDLVERRDDGRLRITDYKTGAPPRASGGSLGGGTRLQRVLYALAYEALNPEAQTAEGRLYYCTARGEYHEAAVRLDERLRERALGLLAFVDDAILAGRLPAVPEPDCSGCDYAVVCGREAAERWRRKARGCGRDPWFQDLARLRRG